MNALTPLPEATVVPMAGDCALLPDHALFVGLCAAEQERIAQTFSIHRFNDGAPILLDGAPMVGVIQSGALARVSRSGIGMQTVGLLLCGDLVSPAGPRTSGVLAMALDRTAIFGTSAEHFRALLREVPRLQLNYLDLVATELQATRGWYTMLGRKTAPERVASLILRLSRQSIPGSEGLIDLLLTRDRIGSLLGLKMETVSRQIRAFSKAGVIEMHSPTKIKVLDKAALVRATGDIWRETSRL
ncbi:Crp/Fnr family transcriptional regulator [Donghicola sp. XS_ASV15]|uniref:Crp/Fnr family transcriptional regulator n=1 Tax=Donghicola sp. XS_ASV15 TaxID=3241295 RepID=UPI00351261F0